MNPLDWIALSAFFAVSVAIGIWSFTRIRQSEDFYVAGGKLPWWLSGVSHHVSGYSGVVFTGYAALAYSNGISLYFWWALNITVACIIGSALIAPRWARLRTALNIESPTEFLLTRYNLPTQQLISWLGILLKLLDTAGKYAAIGVLLYGFAGVPIHYGILLAGSVAMLYVTIGGLWADTLNDFFQFLIQVAAGLAMFFIVLSQLREMNLNYINMWDELSPGNSDPFNEPYTLAFVICFSITGFLSFSGGTWNLAMRFIASDSGQSARKAMRLSAVLYLIWPLILFAPMWASPLLLPDLPESDQTEVYSMLAVKFLPSGLVGLVLASMFAATLSMVASDANAISSVLSRDILPQITKKMRTSEGYTPLWMARLVTFVFTLCTLGIALNSDRFGGIIGLIVRWFGGLLGPAAIPMILGLVPFYKYCGPIAAWTSIISGLLSFIVVNYGIEDASMAVSVGTPVITSLTIFTFMALAGRLRPVPARVDDLMRKLSHDSH